VYFIQDVGQLTGRTKTLQASKNYLRGLVHAKDYEILALQADVANHKILFSRMEKLISDRDAQARKGFCYILNVYQTFGYLDNRYPSGLCST
jgi:hypothetical protein